MKRRSVLTAAAGILVGGAATACGGGGSSTGRGDGTLRVRIAGSMISTDPFREIGTNPWQLLRQVYEGLVSLDDKLNPIPMLAESWKVSDNGLEYTFVLRKGVKFHNDKEMTAEDAKYSLEYYRANAVRKSQLSVISNIQVVDPNTLKVTLSKPLGGFLQTLANPITIAVVPKDSAANDGLVNNPVGTGPYRVDNFANESRAVLKAFKDYQPVDAPPSTFGGRKEPLVETIEILSVPEDQTAMAGIETGEYDIAFEPPAEEYDRIKGMSGVKLLTTDGVSLQALYINVSAAVVKDKSVRGAIFAAIDQKQLVETTAAGRGKVSHTYVPPTATWYRKEASEYWPWEGGVEKAKQLLASSSYQGEAIEIIAGGPLDQQKNAVMIAQQLKAAGINTKIQKLDHTTYQARLNAGKFQIAATGTPLRTPPEILYAEWYSSHGSKVGRFGYHNEMYDTKYDAARLIQDPDKRADAFAELERILKDDAVIDPWYYDEVAAATQSRVSGFSVNPYGFLCLWNVKLSG